MSVCLHVYMYIMQVCAWYLQRLEVTDGCKPLCGYWELNPNPLQEQHKCFSCWTISPAPKSWHLNNTESFIYEHGILVIDLVPLWFLLSKSHILYVFCQIYTYTLHFESANRNGTVHIIPNSICSFLACKKAIDLNINVMPQFCYNCFLLIKYFHAPV